VQAKSVIIATGAHYNRLPLDRLAEFEGVGVYYVEDDARVRGIQRGEVVDGPRPIAAHALTTALLGRQRELGAALLYNARALDWSYWLLFSGVILMVTDLTIAGLVEARLWQSAAPWLDSVRAARPYWFIRTGSAIPIAAGFVALLAGFTTGPRGAGLQSVERTIGLEPVGQIAPRLARAVTGAS